MWCSPSRPPRPAPPSADHPAATVADRSADLGAQRGSTGRDGRPVGRASGRHTPMSRCRICGYTLGQRRTHLNHRHTVIADSVTDAREQLQALADGGQISTGRTGPTAPKLAFVCTGMGPQWWKMCRGLLDVFPAFTDSILRSDRELSRYTDWSLLDELCRDESQFPHGGDRDRAAGQLRHSDRAGRATRAVRDHVRMP